MTWHNKQNLLKTIKMQDPSFMPYSINLYSPTWVALGSELEELLARFGIRYFFLDTHGLLLADPAPPLGVFAPLETPAGAFAFGREDVSPAARRPRGLANNSPPAPRNPILNASRRVIKYELLFGFFISPPLHLMPV